MEKKKRKKIELSKETSLKIIIGLIIAIIILCIFLFSSFLDYYSILEKQKLTAKVIVEGEVYGFDVNKTALTFGTLPTKGGTSYRGILIKNEYDRYIKVKIYSEGNISEIMQISKNNFDLEPGDEQKVDFSVSSAGVEPGVYEGEVVIMILKNHVLK